MNDDSALQGIRAYVASGRFTGIIAPEDITIATQLVDNIMGDLDLKDKLTAVSKYMLIAGYLFSKHSGLADETKMQSENLFADACDRVRQQLVVTKGKVTNVEVEAMASVDQGYKASKERLAKASELRILMEVIRDAVRSAQFSLQAVLKSENDSISDQGV